jgi:hypothetical protein
MPFRAISIDAAVLYAGAGASLARCQTALGGHMLPRPFLLRSPSNFYVDVLCWGSDTRANIEAHLPLYLAKLKEACARPFSIRGESVRILISTTTDAGLGGKWRGGLDSNGRFPLQTTHINKDESRNHMFVAGRTTDREFRERVLTLQELSKASHEKRKKHLFPHSYGITGFSLSCTSDDLTCLCPTHLHWRLFSRNFEGICTSLRHGKKLATWEMCINKCFGIKCVLTSNTRTRDFRKGMRGK